MKSERENVRLNYATVVISALEESYYKLHEQSTTIFQLKIAYNVSYPHLARLFSVGNNNTING